MAQLDDVITYLEMRARPTMPSLPAPLGKLALMRTDNCTVSFYRYLYETVGTPWLWYERSVGDRSSPSGRPAQGQLPGERDDQVTKRPAAQSGRRSGRSGRPLGRAILDAWRRARISRRWR